MNRLFETNKQTMQRKLVVKQKLLPLLKRRNHHPFFLLFYFLFGTVNGQLDQRSILKNIDSLIEMGIQKKAFPGAQILIYKKGRIALERSYGFHTYDSIVPVANHHLYDLASVTKVLAGTLAFMKLYELYSIDLDRPVSEYTPFLKRSNKSKSTFREVLSHSAGWLPYLSHQNTVFKKNQRLKSRTLSPKQNKRFPFPLDDSLFVFKNYPKKIFRRIRRSPVDGIGNYRYSGLWFFLLPQLVTDLTGKSFETFLNDIFYNPLGAERMGFLPSKHFPTLEIVPTEIDTVFRKKLVHGWVHDEAAAMMGGISGNAGLFGNAASISRVLIMLLRGGSIDGKLYLRPETITRFTSKAYPNRSIRRGLGFDKPEIDRKESKAYPSQNSSPSSYGHSGFTGTLVWVDPENDCVFIFLSNRVYPSRDQRGIYDLNIRSQLLDYALEL